MDFLAFLIDIINVKFDYGLSILAIFINYLFIEFKMERYEYTIIRENPKGEEHAYWEVCRIPQDELLARSAVVYDPITKTEKITVVRRND